MSSLRNLSVSVIVLLLTRPFSPRPFSRSYTSAPCREMRVSPPFGSTPDVPGSLTFRSLIASKLMTPFGIAVIDTIPCETQGARDMAFVNTRNQSAFIA